MKSFPQRLRLRPSRLAAVAGLLVLIVAPAVPPRAAGAAADLGDLVQRVRREYGGEAVAKVPGFRARGRILTLTDGISGQVRVSLAMNGSLRVEIRYPDRTEIRILSGKLAWNGGPHGQSFSDEALADSMRLQYHRLAAAFELTGAPIEELEIAGTSEEGWIRVRRRWDEQTATVYEIDPESGRILRVAGELGSGETAIVFVSEAHDFRRVAGVLFAFRTTTIISGHAAAEMILDRVTLEDDFPADEFRPAGAPADI